jgi:hypothetical protein
MRPGGEQEGEARERQFVATIAVIAMMMMFPIVVWLVLEAAMTTGWSWGTGMVVAVLSSALLFGVALVFRLQRDHSKSIFSGRFGLWVALLGLLLVGGLLVLEVWGVIIGELPLGGGAAGSAFVFGAALLHLARRIRENLQSRRRRSPLDP